MDAQTSDTDFDARSSGVNYPEWGFIRPVHFYGDPEKNIPGLLPESPSTFHRKVKRGDYPELKFVKMANMTLITVASAKQLCDRLAAEAKSREELVA